MIDCGVFTKEIKNYIETTLHSHINLLIATHIDYDHIDGLCNMLKRLPNLQIDKILFNCYQRLNGKQIVEMTAEVKSDIIKLTGNLPRQVVDNEGKINMEHASCLASLIMSNANWNNAWTRDYIHKDSEPLVLGGRFGKLVILSPLVEDIYILDDEFAREYMRLTKHKAVGIPFSGQETLYELVLRLVSMKKKEREYINQQKKASALIEKYSEIVWQSALAFKPRGISDENRASIAFVWEYDDNKILFMGDAEPDIIKDSITDKYGKLSDCKAIKISHHGSKHSTSVDLLKVVDSSDYFITGGNESDKPSIEAFSKIVNRDDNKHRTIHYNYERNELMKDMESQELLEYRIKYNFNISSINELEFEY